jgi:hypothetical protein
MKTHKNLLLLLLLLLLLVCARGCARHGTNHAPWAGQGNARHPPLPPTTRTVSPSAVLMTMVPSTVSGASGSMGASLLQASFQRLATRGGT